MEDAFIRFKALADRKKHVYDEDIEALVDEEIASAHDRIRVLSLTVIAGTMGPQSATITLDIDGEHRTVQATGNGPVDATFNCIKALVPHEATLELYQVQRRHRGHRRAGGGVGAHLGGRANGDRARGRHRHARRLGQGLRRGAEQALGEARAPPRAGGVGLTRATPIPCRHCRA